VRPPCIGNLTILVKDGINRDLTYGMQQLL